MYGGLFPPWDKKGTVNATFNQTISSRNADFISHNLDLMSRSSDFIYRNLDLMFYNSDFIL